MSRAEIKMKRVYELPEASDGFRVLVDRLWPRGIRKADAQIDCWLKEIAPSPELRKWFCHDPEKFDAFTLAYEEELEKNSTQREAVSQVLGWLDLQPVTLVYAAKDPVFNHAVVLHKFIRSRM